MHHKNILKFYGAMLADSGHPWNGIITGNSYCVCFNILCMLSTMFLVWWWGKLTRASLSFAETPTQFFFPSEFCGGGILYDLLQDKSREIAFNEKQDWALGIAKGVCLLH